jgi:hypothetical protein
MKKSKIILLIVFTVAALAIAYFAYGVVKKRYLGGGGNNLEIKNDGTQNQTADQSGDNQENTTPDINNTAPGDGRPNIQNADCDNNCANFKDNPDNLKYCQEACGDRPVTKKDSETQCENLAGLEKDSCWRDLAVSKLDSDLCDKISDAKLKKVCKSRVAEELLN